MRPNNQRRRTKFRPHEPKPITQLSETALKQHDAIPILPDDVYAESLIRSEAAQMFERTLGTTTSRAKEAPSMVSKQGQLRSDTPSTSELSSLSNLYRPDDSSSTIPMQRFTTLSPANDPMPWESRRVMADVELATGSFETLQVRVDAAGSLVGGNVASSNSSRVEPVGGGSTWCPSAHVNGQNRNA